MDEVTRDALSELMCEFLNKLILLADKYNYDRDSFVAASAEMFYTMTQISTFEKFKTNNGND